MDRRLTPANDRVAADWLKGQIEAERYVTGTPTRVKAPLADLRRAPDGARDRQILCGAAVTILERYNGWAFVQAAADGYVGYALETLFEDAPAGAVTHRVTARATHAYAAADLKSPEHCSLSLGSLVQVRATQGRFCETPHGFIPAGHLVPMTTYEKDPVSVAERLLGTPYLWGANSAFGIDCSGLVQLSCAACGIGAPGDTDMQVQSLGETLSPGTPPKRGDLLFWKGHVAWLSDPDTLLHANAFHMATAYEPMSTAIARIETQGDGPVTRHARLPELA